MLSRLINICRDESRSDSVSGYGVGLRDACPNAHPCGINLTAAQRSRWAENLTCRLASPAAILFGATSHPSPVICPTEYCASCRRPTTPADQSRSPTLAPICRVRADEATSMIDEGRDNRRRQGTFVPFALFSPTSFSFGPRTHSSLQSRETRSKVLARESNQNVALKSEKHKRSPDRYGRSDRSRQDDVCKGCIR